MVQTLSSEDQNFGFPPKEARVMTGGDMSTLLTALTSSNPFLRPALTHGTCGFTVWVVTAPTNNGITSDSGKMEQIKPLEMICG